MSKRIYGNQPLEQLQNPQQQKRTQPGSGAKGSFNEVLQEKLKQKSGIKFSGHAKQRLNSRNIDLTPQDLNKLEQAVDKAEDKGAKESLILVNEVAYVVSVENKTVITAMDDQNMKENVFTNIDSAVVMD
ncbi:TIGR02530 family flagellar biosynthesis protein [Fuchsiella alkaliacetigena]|uniref:TIGR02530 family flagellar biosynthesis protein n=1 Tax=Fuchsiella alkaliacetigena TaxID=957042 RepID=UPI00200A9C92|nr:TIGR02530 family flagellar biosynthesis protein [Fuchsiella alkaliacetigena]MCK8823547.1 flagellar protein [Fuchsiella alkaliacetigena]